MPAKTARAIPGLNPPPTLSKPAASLWRDLIVTFGIHDTPGRLLVESALESWDRVQATQARIAKDGLAIPDRYGVLKAHPLLAVERASRVAMLRALNALRLDIELPPGAPGRPPTL